MNFAFGHVKFKKHQQESWLVMTGEVINNNGKHFNAVVFRAAVFIKNIPVGNGVFTINGFYNGQTRTFETRIGELEAKIIPEITRYEIYAETAY